MRNEFWRCMRSRALRIKKIYTRGWQTNLFYQKALIVKVIKIKINNTMTGFIS
jgi:hypothetical protein